MKIQTHDAYRIHCILEQLNEVRENKKNLENAKAECKTHLQNYVSAKCMNTLCDLIGVEYGLRLEETGKRLTRLGLEDWEDYYEEWQELMGQSFSWLKPQVINWTKVEQKPLDLIKKMEAKIHGHQYAKT
jgi:hypothetical protein